MENCANFFSKYTEVEMAPYNQVIQTLLDNNWNNNVNSAFIWTLPTIIEEYYNYCTNGDYNKDKLAEDLDSFCDLVVAASEKLDYLFVPLWVSPNQERGLGMLDVRCGLSNFIHRMNAHIIKRLDKSNIYLFDTSRWLCNSTSPYNPKLWYLAKIPFSNDVFRQAASDLQAALNGIQGRAKKLIVLDLDDTLWGGIVGDVGWENINLGGHNSIGESFKDFQINLKALTRRGFVLGIVSKNEEEIALEAIQKHLEED